MRAPFVPSFDSMVVSRDASPSVESAQQLRRKSAPDGYLTAATASRSAVIVDGRPGFLLI
jgi:hypothetical protein